MCRCVAMLVAEYGVATMAVALLLATTIRTPNFGEIFTLATGAEITAMTRQRFFSPSRENLLPTLEMTKKKRERKKVLLA